MTNRVGRDLIRGKSEGQRSPIEMLRILKLASTDWLVAARQVEDENGRVVQLDDKDESQR